MSESFSGAAPAAAEPSGAPIPESLPPNPQPLGSQTPTAPKEPEVVRPGPEPTKAGDPPPKKEEHSKSAGDAITKANEAIKAKAEAKEAAKSAEKSAAEKPTDKPAEATERPAERPRGQDGKFAPREGERAPEAKPAPEQSSSPHREAPQRFSADAKAAWEAAPEPVKAEVHRMQREFQQGYEKHRADAEAWREIKDFDTLSKQNGRGGAAEVIRQAKAIDDTFTQQGPIAGMEAVARHFGFTLRDVAAHVLDQPQDQASAAQDRTIVGLQRELAELKQQMGGVQQTFQRQTEERTLTDVQKFAESRPRFDELSEAIATEIGLGYSLQEAYERADRLNPAPAASRAPASSPDTSTARPLNPAGTKSIAGAPSAGSDPAQMKPPSSSTSEALRKAAARVAASAA